MPHIGQNQLFGEGEQMVPLSNCHSIIDVLRHIKEGGSEWTHRLVSMRFPGTSSAWVMLYQVEDGEAPYFDFKYSDAEPPEKALASLLAKHQRCVLIDWSPGRLATISAPPGDIEMLAEIIHDFVEAASCEKVVAVEASYKEMDRA